MTVMCLVHGGCYDHIQRQDNMVETKEGWYSTCERQHAVDTVFIRILLTVVQGLVRSFIISRIERSSTTIFVFRFGKLSP